MGKSIDLGNCATIESRKFTTHIRRVPNRHGSTDQEIKEGVCDTKPEGREVSARTPVQLCPACDMWGLNKVTGDATI